MKKKIIQILLVISLSLTSVSMPVFAENIYSTNVVCGDGVAVSTPTVSYTPQKHFSVSFTITNEADKVLNTEISIAVTNEAGKSIDSTRMTRSLQFGEAVPIRVATNNLPDETGKLTATINVNVLNSVIVLEDYEIYISPNGTGDGTKENPVGSYAEAVSAAQQRIEASEAGAAKDVAIVFKGGSYNITETINISDMPNADSLTIKAEENSEVIFYGGHLIEGSDFIPVTDKTMFPNASGNVYSIDLSHKSLNINTSQDPMFIELYCNGERKDIARYPNADTGDTKTAITDWTGWTQQSSFTFKTTDNNVASWTNFQDAWVRGRFYADWDLNYGKVQSISGDTITLERLHGGALAIDKANAEGKPWYIYNLPEAMDTEGEYVIKGNTLYFYAPSDFNMETGKIHLNTTTSNMLEISNAQAVTIEGITFQNLQGKFINATENINNLKILGCEFRNNAKIAAEIVGNNNLISSCDFHDIGSTALIVGGGTRETLTSSESVVKNCLFYKTGIVSRTNTPALKLSGCGVTARKNEIRDVPHSAISYSGNNHTIEYNNVYNCLQDNVGDAGIIYVGNSLSNLGTKITHNYIHDTDNCKMGAIYWDDLLSGQTAEYNVFENIPAALFIHGGVCNTFNNNYIFGAENPARVNGKGYRIKLSEGLYFNVWNSSLKDETGNNYNHVNNVFMVELVGSNSAGIARDAMPWKGEIWQQAYGNVLKYVDNKNDGMASETIANGNYLENCTKGIVGIDTTCQASSYLTAVNNTTTVSSEKQQEAVAIKNACGIYIDNYRTSIN